MRARTDFLIIGSGIAGLRAAADLVQHGSVTILTKADPTESNTGYAQGGIAAALGADDAPEEHFADTVAAGDGLCDEGAVRVLVEDGVSFVQELVEWGVAFDREPTGQLALGREAAHRVRRVLHARDATGRAIGQLLWSRVAGDVRVRVQNHTRATDLIVRDGICTGARFQDGTREGSCEAGAVLLATGGAGQVYSDTTNPAIATGDGVPLAWRAGARIADLEFVQFHPTALATPGAPRFLLSEALRGEGAWLINSDGERFMMRYERAGELASRDLVSRAIVKEAARTGHPIFLTMQHLDAEWVHQRFPTIAATCHAAGFDLARDLIPVGPAAHYIMGGVETDTWGRSTIPGLFAAGEVACTGVHGANRLASNSLLEGLVFGARAAQAMVAPLAAGQMANVKVVNTAIDAGGQGGRSNGLLQGSVQSLMWNTVGLIRDAEHLRSAVWQLATWSAQSDLALLGYLIASAALRREESRGGHFRADFAARDDLHWRIHVSQQRRVEGGSPSYSPEYAPMADKKNGAFVTEITPQSEDFSRWYLDVVRKAELADYSPVKGCMVIRPYGYAIWEHIQRQLDDRFKATGHVNAYFPLFIPESLLMREAEHVEGFAPQVAWVTRGGTEELEERLVIRPTSETIIGVMYQRWIQSWRDLPVLINQWANVVRWEKVTRPFLRTTEFLWQEGHTAHETADEAQEETLKILDLYTEFAENVLAIPVVKGQKSESEKFAGATRTYSIEALMGDGRALQAGTSHNLGQNFARAFEIQFQGRDKTVQHAWTTSWGVSTRLIGGVIMAHGDDSGLVLPPAVAPWQVVIVPIPRGNWQDTVLPKCEEIRKQLTDAGIRVRLDADEMQTPGWKFAEYEMRGVPLRLEIGPKDIEKNAVFAARRDTRQKQSLPMDGLADTVKGLLADIQASLLAKALAFRESHTSRTASYDEFKQIMEGRPGFVIAPWCESSQCETDIKAETQATIRNMPSGQEAPTEPCLKCGKPATVYAWFAKAY